MMSWILIKKKEIMDERKWRTRRKNTQPKGVETGTHQVGVFGFFEEVMG